MTTRVFRKNGWIGASLGLFAIARLSSPLAATVPFVADIPLRMIGGFPCIDVGLPDGRPLTVAVDTGNVTSIVNTAALAGEKVPLTPLPGTSGAFKAELPDLAIGSVTFSGCKAYAFKFSPHSLPTGIAGCLAYPVFKDRVIQLDFPGKRFRLSERLHAPQPAAPHSAEIELITFGKSGPPIVVAHGFAIGGKPIRAQLDSLYAGPILIYTLAIDPLGLTALSQTTHVETFPYTDGGVGMKPAPSPLVTFNDQPLSRPGTEVYFPTPGVHEPDGLFEGTIGTPLFAHSVLTIDFFDQTLTVSAPDDNRPG
jgi:hypothetical protein